MQLFIVFLVMLSPVLNCHPCDKDFAGEFCAHGGFPSNIFFKYSPSSFTGCFIAGLADPFMKKEHYKCFSYTTACISIFIIIFLSFSF